MMFITDNLEVFIVLILALTVLFIITFIVMTRRYATLRKNYVSMLKNTNTPDLEKVMIKMHEDIAQLEASLAHEKQRTDDIRVEMKLLKANIGIHRYNAYDQSGSDLSFSIAFVDEYNSGVVLTGLHSREQTYLYVKALEQGESTYALSPEEKIAINQAANKERL